jgi:hypothetical protein
LTGTRRTFLRWITRTLGAEAVVADAVCCSSWPIARPNAASPPTNSAVASPVSLMRVVLFMRAIIDRAHQTTLRAE